MIFLASVGTLVLLVAGAQLPLLLLGVMLFGISVGAELDLMSFFCARLFGLSHYSTNYGLLSVAFYVGMASGGVGYGLIRDLTGGYGLALASSGVMFLGASSLFLRLRVDERSLYSKAATPLPQ